MFGLRIWYSPFACCTSGHQNQAQSHQSHPLVAICRETLSLCDGCGEEHKGFFFSCQECNFWIHQECTLLPSVVKIAPHPHPFILTYSLPSYLLFGSSCIICNRSRLLRYNGVYFCGQCGAYAHSSCAKSKLKNHETDAETRLELIQLPDEGDTFPSLVIRRYLESNPIPDQQDIKDDEKLTLIEKYHDHPLMFHDGISNSSREACLVCDVCIQPINISSPFYRCRQPECHFLVHNICANLSSSIDLVTHWKLFKASLRPAPSKYFFSSVFPCILCLRLCNGPCYVVDDTDDEQLIDIECAVAPNTIKHASHGQHVLFRTTRQSETIPLKCCSGETIGRDVYRCVLCDFHIHLRCALLPKRTRHKFDEHPLELITRLPNEQEHDEYNYCFCEFCEQDIDQKYWYYGCGKCKQCFHINCIPSVGYLSKVKFGGTLNISSHIHHHHVTLTRMLTVGGQRCGRCEKIIQGFVDEMAFLVLSVIFGFTFLVQGILPLMMIHLDCKFIGKFRKNLKEQEVF